MRYLIILCFMPCLISCGSKETSTSSSTDTVQSQSLPDNTQTSDSTHNPALDSTVYIGYADYLTETDELSLALSSTSDDFKPQLDSLIYSEDEGDGVKRQRVAKSALKAFPLAGLEQITVYDEKNHEVAKARFERVELYEDPMTTQYIAVYKPGNFKPAENARYYGVGKNASGFHSNFSYTEFFDVAFTKTLLTKLKKDTAQIWVAHHYRTQPGNIVYSALSGEKESMITEYNGDATIVMNSTDDFHFTGIIPLPFFKNGKPLMLVSAAIPDSDVFWEGPAAYKDGAYVADALNRVKL